MKTVRIIEIAARRACAVGCDVMVVGDAAYDELRAYTLGQVDAAFIHQHVVDTYAVQTATEKDRPIRLAQALVGLYLHVEHELTGRQVQRVHQIVADRRPQWPRFVLPADRGPMTVGDVVAEPPGKRRDRAIEAWATSTWQACRHQVREAVDAFLVFQGITAPMPESARRRSK
jgi:Family of unknown function (DUF5946)